MDRKYRIWAVFGLALAPAVSMAQVPVDDDGNPLGAYEPATPYEATGEEGIPLLSQAELEPLVGPIALYPDDLLAVVLPAATYPLQVVQAARFLEELESNPELKPDPDWDDSIIALINYPEVVALLNEDLDWTWQLGEAVVAQQADVVTAVETFRNRAYAAGNLKTDSYQEVSHDDGVIEITPANEDVIYVPYYEPEHVVVHQPRRVYYYYPDPCPVYYYPYPGSHSFRRGYFWGVTTAFTIGWASDRLRVYHPSYTGHPYYGRHYWNRWWYRRPSITVYNNLYINHHRNLAARRYSHGDYWRPSGRTRLRYTDQRITRNRYYGNRAQEVADRRVYPNNSRHTVRRESTRDNVIRRQSRRSDEYRRPRQRSRSERNAPDERRMVQIARSDAQRREQRRGPDRQARQRDRQPPPARQSRQRDRQPPPVHQSRQRDRQPAPVRESRNRTPQRDAERESRAKRSEGSRSQRKRGGRRRHN